jgi:excisionase family DNA binding protein
MTAPDLPTAAEAAALLRVDVRRAQALARAGRLPGVRAGRRWRFARRADVSRRDQLRTRVVGRAVDGVMPEVELALGDQRVGVAEGQKVLALIESSEVVVARAAAHALASAIAIA